MYGPRPIRFPAHWCAGYSKYRGFLAGGISTASFLLPFFGTRLRRQNFNLAPTQYRHLRRLALYVPPMPGGNLFLPALYSGIACESHIKKDTRKNITKNIARKDHR